MLFLIQISRLIALIGLAASLVMLFSQGFGTTDSYYQPLYDSLPEMFHDEIAEVTGDQHKHWVSIFFGSSSVAFLILLINLSLMASLHKKKECVK